MPGASKEHLLQELHRLVNAFVRHRQKTHEVAPTFCLTCRQSDGVIARVKQLLE